MAENQNFRIAMCGFNREDVVHYLEYLTNKHQGQVSQLNARIAELENQADASPVEEMAAQLEQLREENQVLLEEKEAMLRRQEELEGQLQELTAQLEASTEPESRITAQETADLDSYRRAQKLEKESRMRSELVYFQANGVLTEASAKVEGLTDQITQIADQAMQELTRLQVAVSGSKHVLQDAAEMMKAIRPNP